MKIITIDSGNTKCYLLKTAKGHILIDAGISTSESDFVKKIIENGVKKDNDNYLILTHGHYDHVGNSVILRKEFNFKIAMHENDVDLVKNGKNDFPKSNTALGNIIRRISQKQMNNIVWKCFSPDILLMDGDWLGELGIEAKIIHTPGHTKGSICILASDGALFCGDLFMNMGGPRISLFADDFNVLEQSGKKIFSENFTDIYPGHGKVFAREKIKF